MTTMTTTRVTRPRSRLNDSENQHDEAVFSVMHIVSVHYTRAPMNDADLGCAPTCADNTENLYELENYF